MIFYIFLFVNKSHEKTYTNNKCILLTNIVCLSTAWCIFFLCAIELHCCPKTIKNTSVSHTVALGHMLLYYHEHEKCGFFCVNTTYTVKLPQILTWAPNVY